MADLILSIKDEEADYYHRVSGGRPVLTVGLDPATLWGERQPEPRKLPAQARITAGFIGSVNLVNVKAVQALVAALRRQESEHPALAEVLQVNIYGSICRELRGLELPGCMQLRGFIDEALDFYDEVDIALICTVRSTGLKIKAVEALRSRRILLATADGFSGIASPYPFHGFADVPALVADLAATALAEPTAKTDRLATQAAATEAVHQAYSARYRQSLSALLGELGKPVRTLVADHAADDEGWLRTLTMLRAALPALAARYALVVHQPAGDLSPAQARRVAQVARLVAALPAAVRPVLAPAPTQGAQIRLEPGGLMWIEPDNPELRDLASERLALTGFARNRQGGWLAWLPRDAFPNPYWGPDSAIHMLLDGLPPAVAVQLALQAQLHLRAYGVVLPVHHVVLPADLAACEAAAAAEPSAVGAVPPAWVALDDWLADVRCRHFHAVVDAVPGHVPLWRRCVAYTLGHAFYHLVDARARDTLQMLRGDECAMTLCRSPLEAFHLAARAALSEDTVQQLNTYQHPVALRL